MKIVRVTWENSYSIIYFCIELWYIFFFFFWQGMAFKDIYIYHRVLIRNWRPQHWMSAEVREHFFFSMYSLSPQYILVKRQRPELYWHLNHRKPRFIWQKNDALCLAFWQFHCPFLLPVDTEFMASEISRQWLQDPFPNFNVYF